MKVYLDTYSVETSRIWGAIGGLRYDFEQKIDDAKRILDISHEEHLSFYRKKVMNVNTRRKVSVHVVSGKLGHENQSLNEVSLNSKTLKEFQNSCEIVRCNSTAKPISVFMNTKL